MIDDLLSVVAPHPCCSCGVLGAVLCEHCKYNINDESYGRCLACGLHETAIGVCENCSVPYSRAWCVGERSGVLQRLIGTYKFKNAYAVRRDIAALLDAHIDQLPADVIVVPVPTTPAHIRERGYDHARGIAQEFARLRRLTMVPALRRVGFTKQRGAGQTQRVVQAKQAFEVAAPLTPGIYLLIDDIVTTGATIHYAAKTFIDAGATEVWVAAVARQPLD